MPYYIDLPYHLSDGTTELTMTDGKKMPVIESESF